MRGALKFMTNVIFFWPRLFLLENSWKTTLQVVVGSISGRYEKTVTDTSACLYEKTVTDTFACPLLSLLSVYYRTLARAQKNGDAMGGGGVYFGTLWEIGDWHQRVPDTSAWHCL